MLHLQILKSFLEWTPAVVTQQAGFASRSKSIPGSFLVFEG